MAAIPAAKKPVAATRRTTARPVKTRAPANEPCDLCGAPLGLGFRERWRHAWRNHPAYARGLLLRLIAPLAFIGLMIVLTAMHAPPVVLLGALGVCLVIVAIGVAQARTAKQAAGSPPSLRFRALLQHGGLRFLLLSVILVLLLITALRP
jgi:hypothetical protein